MIEILAGALLYVVPLLLGVIVHEVAHGWVAEKCGDSTARDQGRITLNPLVHIDLMGTIILPGLLLMAGSPFLFGWAKPVPVDPSQLRGGRSDMARVSVSGPLANLALAVVSALVFHAILFGTRSGWIGEGTWSSLVTEPLFHMAYYSVRVNLVLMLVNLMPIPPLDGGHFLMGVLPVNLAASLGKIEPYGILVLLLLLASGVWGSLFGPVFRGLIKLLGM